MLRAELRFPEEEETPQWTAASAGAREPQPALPDLLTHGCQTCPPDPRLRKPIPCNNPLNMYLLLVLFLWLNPDGCTCMWINSSHPLRNTDSYRNYSHFKLRPREATHANQQWSQDSNLKTSSLRVQGLNCHTSGSQRGHVTSSHLWISGR